jgi:hypothetical protein
MEQAESPKRALKNTPIRATARSSIQAPVQEKTCRERKFPCISSKIPPILKWAMVFNRSSDMTKPLCRNQSILPNFLKIIIASKYSENYYIEL